MSLKLILNDTNTETVCSEVFTFANPNQRFVLPSFSSLIQHEKKNDIKKIEKNKKMMKEKTINIESLSLDKDDTKSNVKIEFKLEKDIDFEGPLFFDQKFHLGTNKHLQNHPIFERKKIMELYKKYIEPFKAVDNNTIFKGVKI
jgi:hypothetical protein